MIDLTSTEYEADWRRVFSDDEHARMLDDIARVALVLGQDQLPSDVSGGLEAPMHSISLIERLLFFEWMLPQLSPLLNTLSHQAPLRLERQQRRVSPPVRARHVEQRALIQALRHGPHVTVITETIRRCTNNSPENQMTLSFLRQLLREATRLESQAMQAHECDLAERARTCKRRLRTWQEQPWCQEITEQAHAWLSEPTQRMRVDPIYAGIARWIRRYRQSFTFDWTNPLLMLPPRETWRIYEGWSLFRALEALLTLGYTANLSADNHTNALVSVNQQRVTFSLAKGSESRIILCHETKPDVEVFYNRAYREQVHSISRTMIPDITLQELTSPSHKGRRWVLDPKFKTYETPGSEGADINQMHAYRDAVIAGSPPIKPIGHAWCLYAGRNGGPNRPEIVYGPTEMSVVGALCLRPGDASGLSQLCRLLETWIV